jgi:hypothetical protein
MNIMQLLMDLELHWFAVVFQSFYTILQHDDGVQFSGYLLIHMNFTRPINVVAGEIPPTIYEAINTGIDK